MTGNVERYAAITGWGRYLPERVLTNADLEKLVDTNDEWIVSRTGIRERRIAAPDETTATMATAAARAALEVAGLTPSDLDLIIVATASPDHFFPSTACIVQHQLGIPAFPRSISAPPVPALCTPSARRRSSSAQVCTVACS